MLWLDFVKKNSSGECVVPVHSEAQSCVIMAELWGGPCVALLLKTHQVGLMPAARSCLRGLWSTCATWMLKVMSTGLRSA